MDTVTAGAGECDALRRSKMIVSAIVEFLIENQPDAAQAGIE